MRSCVRLIASLAVSLLGTAPLPAAGSAVDVSIGSPGAVTTDAKGAIYFSAKNIVFKLDSAGSLTRVAGNGTPGYSGDGGPAVNALLNIPYDSYPELAHDPIDNNPLVGGLAVDASGNLYIADAYNNRIRKVDRFGIITTVAGGGNGNNATGSAALGASLSWPQGVAFDSAGRLYVTSVGGALYRVSTDGLLTLLAGNNCGPTFAGPGLCVPEGIAVDAGGNVYVADGYCRVRKVGTDGSVVTIAGLDQVPRGGFAFTCDFSGDGGPATQAALSNQPFGVAVDGNGNVYVADTYNNRIRKIDATGTITTVAGMGLPGYSGDGGPARNAQLNLPHGVAVDTAGNIYIADTANNRIRKVSSDGIITTVAGNGGGTATDLPAPSVSIGAGFTGSWYDPTQSGQALFFEVLSDNRFFATWDTFNPAGTAQAWFTGVGTYSGNTATITAVEQPTGGRWMPNFDPHQIVLNPWGSLTFTFTDCNHGRVDFKSTAGYGMGSMDLTRLTLPAGLSCP